MIESEVLSYYDEVKYENRHESTTIVKYFLVKWSPWKQPNVKHFEDDLFDNESNELLSKLYSIVMEMDPNTSLGHISYSNVRRKQDPKNPRVLYIYTLGSGVVGYFDFGYFPPSQSVLNLIQKINQS